MNPHDLRHYLDRLLRNDIRLSTMIWGPPGIGKSSIVAQIAQTHGIEFIDGALVATRAHRFAWLAGAR